tara:strand:- start:8619 stop:9137 length:519 start_codon:yes stop_codon:yes gene_type:complete
MDKLVKILILALSGELIKQGHKNTGALIDSMRGQVDRLGLGVDIYANKYAIFLNLGVKKNRIPYSRGRGRGGRSKYIEGLIAYFKQKGAADPKAAAFATANKHKEEGMPTRGSRRFSTTGKRTHFINEALDKNKEVIERHMMTEATKKIDKEIEKKVKSLETHGGGSGVWIY